MLHLIVNQYAQAGNHWSAKDCLKQELKKRGIAHQIHVTHKPGDTTRMAAALSADPEVTEIWIVGGDGTINEAINGIQLREDLKIAYLPAGSGNDFARGLGIPLKLQKASEYICSAKNTRAMDIGEMEILDASKRCRFVGSSGIGYDASVCAAVNSGRTKKWLNKLKIGKLSYFVNAVRQVFVNPRFTMTITTDQGTKTYEQVTFACFMIHKYEGGGLKMAPAADAADGKLSVVIAYGLSPFKILFLLPTLFRGTHVRHREIIELNTEAIDVVVSGKQYVHTDGEVPGAYRHIRVRCLPGALQMPEK